MAASVALRIDLPVFGVTSPVTFADGVREHQDEVYGVALRITGDRDAALDVASSTFLKAYRAFDRFDQSRPLRHWLLRIATNEAISYARKRGRELRRRVDVEEARALPDSKPAPDTESVAREERERIRAAVSLLPESSCSVISTSSASTRSRTSPDAQRRRWACSYSAVVRSCEALSR